MPDVVVRYYNIIRDAAGRPEEQVALADGATVLDLLALVSRDHGAKMERFLLTREGGKSPYLSLFVNGKRVEGAGVQLVLAEGDVVMMLPAIAGGDR